MTGAVVIDTNLVMLLAVGATSRSYISRHKRLQEFSEDDFDLLGLLVAQFSDIVLTPHILAEVSNLLRQIGNPARRHIQTTFGRLVAMVTELQIPSIAGIERDEFDALGLTDAVILHLCDLRIHGVSPTLLTTDAALADRANSLGYAVIDYRQEFQG